MKKFLLFLLAAVSMPLWLPLTMHVFGYYTYTTGWRAATKIVEGNGNIEQCKKVIVMPWEIFSPGGIDQRMDCIQTYAELTKDPSACELLMPSSYGLSCVGGAISARKMCNLNEKTVSWWENEEKEIVGSVSFESCQRDDQSGTVKRNECCLIARVTRVIGQDDCTALAKNQALHDECLSGLAFKNRDSKKCLDIQDKNLQSACLVRTKAMKQNPSICSGCREPVNNLSELK